jgi:hypothetical protein
VLNLSLGQLRREPGRHRLGGAADGHAVRAEQAGAAHLRHRQRRQQATNGYTGGIGYPARFDECMAVGATNWSDRKASYSNYGAQIEISAPGGDSNAQGTAAGFILAPLHSSNSYTWKTGTSMATPQVAGLAALLYATGMKTAAEVRHASGDLPTTSRRRAGTIGRARGASTCTVRSPASTRTRRRGRRRGRPRATPATRASRCSSTAPHRRIRTARPSRTPGTSGNPTAGRREHVARVQADPYVHARRQLHVTLTVTDAAGLSTTAASTAVIRKSSPSSQRSRARRCLQGRRTTAAGSVHRRGPPTAGPPRWTTAGGAGAQPLALTSKTFALSPPLHRRWHPDGHGHRP